MCPFVQGRKSTTRGEPFWFFRGALGGEAPRLRGIGLGSFEAQDAVAAVHGLTAAEWPR